VCVCIAIIMCNTALSLLLTALQYLLLYQRLNSCHYIYIIPHMIFCCGYINRFCAESVLQSTITAMRLVCSVVRGVYNVFVER